MQQSCTVIAVANQKGGVGKTTTAENLGIGLFDCDEMNNGIPTKTLSPHCPHFSPISRRDTYEIREGFGKTGFSL